jgi:hypothetical protein
MKLSRAIVVCLFTLAASPVSAQDQEHESFLRDVVKQVFLDPTTYAPAVVAWHATRLDWRSSQVFFQNGFYEDNPRFTISGRGHDTAIGYAAGNRKIFIDAVANLQFSLVNNLPERVIERLLIRRYPHHRKLLRAIGWIERSAVASYWAYRLSARHFRQWQENERRAAQLGYR